MRAILDIQWDTMQQQKQMLRDMKSHIPLAEYVGRASTLHASGRFFVLPVCHCFLGR